MNRRAFTLIELMIVVAIIGILAAVAIQKVDDMMHPAKRLQRAERAKLERGSSEARNFCPYCGHQLP